MRTKAIERQSIRKNETMTDIRPEDARRILRKNQENLVRKVADGKVLNQSDQDALQAIIDEDNSLTSKQLADELGVSRRTIFYLRKNADAPTTTDVEEWREFLEARAMLEEGGQLDHLLPEELQKTKHKLLKAQAGKEEAVRKLRELELKQESKELVPSSSAREEIKSVMSPLRAVLDALPKLVCHHANPSNPTLAEEAIEDGLQNAFAQIQKQEQESKKDTKSN